MQNANQKFLPLNIHWTLPFLGTNISPFPSWHFFQEMICGLPRWDMGVSKNNGTPKSSILIGFSIIFTIHFGVPLFLETPICHVFLGG